MPLINRVKNGFKDAFSHAPSFVVKAPGRVNLIGEHTDYNDGFVLPCAIEYATLIAVSPREDRLVKVVALDYLNESDEFLLNESIDFVENKMWANYVRGVVSELFKRKLTLTGCNIAIVGNVPQGAGLSSSAALEVGIAYMFDQLCSLGLTKQEIALVSQAAENNFVGCACGIMDQLVSACGKDQKAIGIDCRSLELTEVSIPDGMTIMMINSNVAHSLVDSEYNVRRQQCEQAAKFFGVSHLRDVSIDEFEKRKNELEAIVAKRAEHIIYENQRTVDAMHSFNNSEIKVISRLMAESHQSMKNLFEITTPEVDYLVSIISEFIGTKGGARMTGGGFGGCVVALVPHDLVDSVKNIVAEKYESHTGIKENVYISQPVEGVAILSEDTL